MRADLSPKSSALLGIQSLPTLVVFGPDGSELGRVAGVLPPRQLDALLEGLAPANAGSRPPTSGVRSGA